MLRGEPQKQARKAYASRAQKSDQRSEQSEVALEANALRGDGVEVPAAHGVLTATLRKMAKLAVGRITALEHAFRQRRASMSCCKVCSGPTPEESVIAASGLEELLARLKKESWSVFPPLASNSNDNYKNHNSKMIPLTTQPLMVID
jgi:hypothetical protein